MSLLEFPLPPTIQTGDQQWSLPEPNTFVSPNSSDTSDSEFEQLVNPEEPATHSFYIKPQHRPVKDIFFLFLYAGCLLIFIAVGFYQVFSNTSNIAITKSIFYLLVKNAGNYIIETGLLSTLSFLSIVGSLIWLFLLKQFSKVKIN